MALPIALIGATPAGFNPGMLFVEAMGHAFIQRHGLGARTRCYRFVTLPRRLAHLEPGALARAMARMAMDVAYVDLETPEQLAGAQPFYWGDFLHMRQYLLTVPPYMTGDHLTERDAARLLLLTDAPDTLVEHSLSFGTTMIFNTEADLRDPAYGLQLARFVHMARCVLVRDVVSAAQLTPLLPPGRPAWGLDAAQLAAGPQSWRSAIPGPCDLSLADPATAWWFFSRSEPDEHRLPHIIGRLSQALGLPFRWLPWGDETAFPRLTETMSRLGVTAGAAGGEPSLSALLEAVAHARLIVTDTYHLAVIAWSLGVPAITVLGRYWPGPRDVNAGPVHARIDKRVVFHAQHGLLEFLIDRDAAADPAMLEARLALLVARVAEGETAASHRATIARRAAWCEDHLLAHLDAV